MAAEFSRSGRGLSILLASHTSRWVQQPARFRSTAISHNSAILSASAGEDNELQRASSSATVRPFSDIPIPGGAVPFFGHLPLMRMYPGVQILEMIRKWFKELGPIFRLKFPCKKV